MRPYAPHLSLQGCPSIDVTAGLWGPSAGAGASSGLTETLCHARRSSRNLAFSTGSCMGMHLE